MKENIAYHLRLRDKSLKPKVESKIELIPYVPKGIVDNKQSKGWENDSLARICVAPTIDGCILGLQPSDSQFKESGGYLVYDVYKNIKPLKELKILSNDIIIEKKYVFDAHVTGEFWILEKCEFEYVKSIKCYSYDNAKYKTIHFKPIVIGDSEYLNPKKELTTYLPHYEIIHEDGRDSSIKQIKYRLKAGIISQTTNLETVLSSNVYDSNQTLQIVRSIFNMLLEEVNQRKKDFLHFKVNLTKLGNSYSSSQSVEHKVMTIVFIDEIYCIKFIKFYKENLQLGEFKKIVDAFYKQYGVKLDIAIAGCLKRVEMCKNPEQFQSLIVSYLNNFNKLLKVIQSNEINDSNYLKYFITESLDTVIKVVHMIVYVKESKFF